MSNKCLILDLDETLVHSHSEDAQDSMELLKDLGIYMNPQNYDLRERTYKINMDDVVSLKKGEGIKTEMWGIFRPHVKEFLTRCFKHFKIVVVWSAGKKNYVHAIVDRLFADIGRPHIIWTYDDIEKQGKTLIKPVHKLIEKIPGLSKYMTLENTFIVDDRSSVFNEVNPGNGIEIPPYRPDFSIPALKNDDQTLKHLIRWFERPDVALCKDVRELDKRNIFDASLEQRS